MDCESKGLVNQEKNHRFQTETASDVRRDQQISDSKKSKTSNCDLKDKIQSQRRRSKGAILDYTTVKTTCRSRAADEGLQKTCTSMNATQWNNIQRKLNEAAGRAISLVGLGFLDGVMGQDSLGTLGSNVSFLESGLTTLGVLSAAVTVLARADLAFESLLRDSQYSLVPTNHHLRRNAAGFLNNAGGGSGDADVLLVTNITSKLALTLVTTRLDQGCGGTISVASWQIAFNATTSQHPACSCVVVSCEASCATSLVSKWGEAVIRLRETRVLLYSVSCWSGDAHWQCSTDGRPRVSEDAIRERANGVVESPSLALAVTSLEGWDSAALVVALDDTMDPRLAKMVREEFTTRDEASRNKIPETVLGLLEVGIERENTTDSNWTTSKWRCFLLHVLEIIVMVSLTLIFTIDPFTTSLAARRVVVSYVASESGRGPYAGHFVDKLRVWRSKQSGVHTYVWNIPELVNAAHVLVMGADILVWVAITGLWMGRVSGVMRPIVYHSGLYVKAGAGPLAWSLAGVAQTYACVAEMWMRDDEISTTSMVRRVYSVFPRWEIGSSMVVVMVGGVLPRRLWKGREGFEALAWVASLWGSAVATWILSVWRSNRHYFNSLPPSTGYTLYYSAAFIKLAALTAGSGAWR